ncbi:hypothetical protein CRG98_013549 [Punica granatum]|uniref:Uncharacterized protein n=1 Tax=Punica granatum TaxID=22663 RepID=A0A2I0KBZ0_PUNGR|nr:hypothetical protein CRG98_013549 [Punica granatum]
MAMIARMTVTTAKRQLWWWLCWWLWWWRLGGATMNVFNGASSSDHANVARRGLRPPPLEKVPEEGPALCAGTMPSWDLTNQGPTPGGSLVLLHCNNSFYLFTVTALCFTWAGHVALRPRVARPKAFLQLKKKIISVGSQRGLKLEPIIGGASPFFSGASSDDVVLTRLLMGPQWELKEPTIVDALRRGSYISCSINHGKEWS